MLSQSPTSSDLLQTSIGKLLATKEQRGASLSAVESAKPSLSFKKKKDTIPKFASMPSSGDAPFSLDLSFLHMMQKEKEPWSADEATGKPENVAAALVYYRTYSRNGQPWYRCVQRVVEGTFRIQQRHFASLRKKWNPREMQKTAQEMYRRIFAMKFLPPGRGLWATGTSVIEEKGLIAALYNCSFVSTKDIDRNPTDAFAFLMDASMLGVGVGTDMRGAGKLKIHNPVQPSETYVIPDSREGWVESTKRLIASYARNNRRIVDFDYSMIRKEGTPLKTFGGVSAGAGPLKSLHADLRKTLGRYVGKMIDSRGIADICNLIGVAVVSGNIRRTAEILFGDHNDELFINLKNYAENPDRAAYGWTSNNSIMAELGMNYSDAAERIRNNGEPGFIWLENARAYSRMMESEKDFKDYRVAGANPCVEISLEDGEMCNLVETFPNHHENLKDFLETLRYAFLYAKTVTLLPSHWEKTNEVMLRNRRIGTGVSGVAQFLADRSLHELKIWLETGYAKLKEYDVEISDSFCIPRSIKLSTIKPSGTVSLIASATPGMHYPLSNYYIRRVTLAKNSPYVPKLREAGYVIEVSAYDPEHSVVVELPMCVGEKVRCQNDVSMWEQLNLAAFLQKYWSDNQVSATITFDKAKEGHQIEKALDQYQYQLKGISFLPSTEASKTYKIFGRIKDEDILCFGPLFDDLVKLRYDESKDVSFVEFDAHNASDAMIEKILSRWKDSGYKVDSRLVTPYAQMPYEPITPEMYNEMTKHLKPVQWDESGHLDASSERKKEMDCNVPAELQFCDGDKCVL